jgi:hypothetical protein
MPICSEHRQRKNLELPSHRSLTSQSEANEGDFYQAKNLVYKTDNREKELIDMQKAPLNIH